MCRNCQKLICDDGQFTYLWFMLVYNQCRCSILTGMLCGFHSRSRKAILVDFFGQAFRKWALPISYRQGSCITCNNRIVLITHMYVGLYISWFKRGVLVEIQGNFLKINFELLTFPCMIKLSIHIWRFQNESMTVQKTHILVWCLQCLYRYSKTSNVFSP